MSDQYNDGFYDGEQSRQAEIDELKKELETLQGIHKALSFVAGELVENKEAALGYLNDIESFGSVKNIEVINKINGILRENPND